MKKIAAAVAVLMAIQGCSSLNEGDAARYSAIAASNKATTDAKVAAAKELSSMLAKQAETIKAAVESGKGTDAAMIAMAMTMAARDASDAMHGIMNEKQQEAPATTASQLGDKAISATLGMAPFAAVAWQSWASMKTAETGIKNAGGVLTVGNNSNAGYKGSSVVDERVQASNLNEGEVQKVVGGDNAEKPEEPAEEPEPEPEPKEEEK